MYNITNEIFEKALDDENNRAIIGNVCKNFRGILPESELKYRGHMGLFECLKKHKADAGNKFTTSLHYHTLWQCYRAVRDVKRQEKLEPITCDIVSSNCSVLDNIAIHECINMLNNDHKNIIIDYYFQKKTLEEIGKERGYSSVTAFNTLRRAEEAFALLYGKD